MAKVVIYSKKICPYCTMAANLLKMKGVTSWQEIKIDENPDKLSEMMEKSGGRRTVPQIFIDDKHIGGFDDLSALDKKGELEKLL